MSDFIAHIVGELDLSAARSQMDSFLSEYENKKIEITPQINSSGLDKALSGNSGQYQKAGQNIGKQISSGINSGINKVGNSGAVEFSKAQQEIRKEIKNTADELQKVYPDLSKKKAKQDARDYYATVAEEQERSNKIIQKNAEKAQREATISSNKREAVVSKYVEDEKGDAVLSRMRKQMESYAGQSTPNIEKANELIQDFSTSLSTLKDHKSGVSILDDDALDNTIQKLEKAESSFKNVFSQIRDSFNYGS